MLSQAEFSPRDALRLEARRRDLADLGPHGYPMSEATSPLGDPANRAGDWRWEVPTPTRDFVQTAIASAQAAFEKNYPDADTSGLLWRAQKVMKPKE